MLLVLMYSVKIGLAMLKLNKNIITKLYTTKDTLYSTRSVSEAKKKCKL